MFLKKKWLEFWRRNWKERKHPINQKKKEKEKKERHGDVFVIPTSKKESKKFNCCALFLFFILIDTV